MPVKPIAPVAPVTPVAPAQEPAQTLKQQTEVTNQHINHRNPDGSVVITVTFTAKEGMGTYHAYLSSAEAARWPLGAQAALAIELRPDPIARVEDTNESTSN